jgi:hypothetical protein
MQDYSSIPPPPSTPFSSQTEFLGEQVRAGLNRRGSAPTESEVLRLVKALSRLQPAALSALASSPSADPENAFSATLQNLAV